MKITILLTVFLFMSCTQNFQKETSMIPPTAEKIPKEMTIHGHTRIDDYYWMRLTDDQKNASEPDAQTQKVVDYMDKISIILLHDLFVKCQQTAWKK